MITVGGIRVSDLGICLEENLERETERDRSTYFPKEKRRNQGGIVINCEFFMNLNYCVEGCVSSMWRKRTVLKFLVFCLNCMK